MASVTATLLQLPPLPGGCMLVEIDDGGWQPAAGGVWLFALAAGPRTGCGDSDGDGSD